MVIQVKVKSRAKENKVVVELFENSYTIYTKEPAIEGRANYSVIELLAKYFNVSKSQIHIKVGLTSKNKVIVIDE